jgi:hypothetical protein
MEEATRFALESAYATDEALEGAYAVAGRLAEVAS